MAAITSTIKVEINKGMVKSFLSGFSEATADHLQSITRVKDADGSEWIDAADIDALIAKLRS